MSYLYRHIIQNEEMCEHFLSIRGLLPIDDQTCTKIKNQTICGGELKKVLKNSRKRDSEGNILKTIFNRCTKKGCQTFYSIRKNNSFFTYMDRNGKCNSGLNLCDIVELVWYWVFQIKVTQVEVFTKRSRSTIVDWYNLCRDVAVAEFQKRKKMGGPGLVVQIDESLFQGKRKYNRGRLRLGDRKPEENEESSDEDEVISNQNYGQRIQGPWIFGLCCKHDGILERRFFKVEKRDRNTLLPIILNEVEQGTTIYSDKWRAYSTLNEHGFIHKTVNHSENFIDPITGAETQTIETLWRHVKNKYNIKTRGATDILQSQLQEEWWRSCHQPTEDLFEVFLGAIKNTYT